MNDDFRSSPAPANQPAGPEPSPVAPSPPTAPAPVVSLDDNGNTPDWQKASKRESRRSIITTIIILLSAPLIAWVLINTVFQSYVVDGPSMEQTLHNGDRLIVVKTGKTWASLTRSNYVPKRGEVIVFVEKGVFEGTSSQEKQLIKRVIGVPGDRVVVQNGSVTIYNDEHPDGFNPDVNAPWSDFVDETTEGNVDLTVQEGEVFVCGDNRDNSLDSRAFGTVPSRDIVGEAVLRILPINKAQKI